MAINLFGFGGKKRAEMPVSAKPSERQVKKEEKPEAKQKPAPEKMQEKPAPAAETDPVKPAGNKDKADADAVFSYFKEICSIPHGSGNTRAISDYLVSFADAHGLENIQDALGNVIIKKPASKGKEDADALILQGHMDMVCEKNEDVDIDMENEPITLIEDGDFLHADGTTLGGDDGIAVAMMLSVLSDDTLVHPALECIFTVDEETGMNGAEGLDMSGIKGTRMINLDSEKEGVLTAGCAGGAMQTLTIPVRRKEKNGVTLKLTVEGLLGGHSGEMIGKGRANALIVLGRLLDELYDVQPFCLQSINGGTKSNAIPRSAWAQVLLPYAIDRKKIKKTVRKFGKALSKEYRATDPDISVNSEYIVTDAENSQIVLGKKDTRKVLDFLTLTPNGLIRSNPEFPDIPLTSLNLGSVRTLADGIEAQYLVRSNINSERKMLSKKLAALARVLSGGIKTTSEFPAWEYEADSPFRSMLVRIYKEETGKDMRVEVTHGGLECGLLAAKVKKLDCVSIGPDMEGVHTPDEKLSISSVKRTWAYLCAVLGACAGN